MTAVLDAALLADVAAELGEGPAWDAERGVLSWVDILAGRVHVMSAGGDELRRYDIGHAVGAALPARDGGFLLADARGFTRLSEDGATADVLDLFTSEPAIRFNDAKCDPAGRAFAGSAAENSAPVGQLYRLDGGPKATPVLSDLAMSNGLGWSPGSRILWFADSGKPVVTGYEYDLESGALGAVDAVIELQETKGVPDGLCVDDDGCVWVALWDAGAVHRYTPDGTLDTVVRLPVEQVTSCTFGGPAMSTLFITTSCWDMAPEALRSQPGAGGIFVVETGTTGPAATPWRNPAED
ncbi:MAG: SMP-30/Gluconolaconase/LRE domain protein [Conexibacter sp.]|nr:SMP-30/Gluconolaconase/LRE domain protein [Conexibacter sp.]